MADVVDIREVAAKRAKKEEPRRSEYPPEFEEWIDDMGYERLRKSPAVYDMMFDAFAGGWGAKIKQLKKKKRDHV